MKDRQASDDPLWLKQQSGKEWLSQGRFKKNTDYKIILQADEKQVNRREVR